MNWEKYIIPQNDGADAKLFQKQLASVSKYEPLTPPDDADTWLNGRTELRDVPESSTNMEASRDPELLDNLESALKLYPEGYEMTKIMLDVLFPAVNSKGRRGTLGCMCGIYGKAFKNGDDPPEVGVMVTIDNSLGGAEGIVHELGHHKIHALDIHLERYSGRYIANDPDDVFPSPVRFDKLRPMAAVFQAEFSYVYVTRYYQSVIDFMIENEMKHVAGNNRSGVLKRQAYNLKRIGNGIHILRDNLETTDEGKKMFDIFMNYAVNTWYNSFEQYKKLGVADEFDWSPEDGKP